VSHEASEDQRRALRIPVDLPVRYRSETSSVDGRAEDISQDGMRFVGCAPPADDFAVELLLEIDLPDTDEPLVLSVSGEICWTSASPTRSMGIRFTRMEKLARRRLANFVIRRACSH
jgi:c-di-GMP-binding flagellar brake protein YcgR